MITQHGLESLVVLIINREGQEEAIDKLEDYPLPVMQDTAEADVFGAWDASSYDLFVLGTAGTVDYVQTGSHPVQDHDQLVEVLSSIR